ncbi:G5 domain-containing protein [Litchfieldia alkalitelluris]|uniref:G5 domain-containing protein n=1 Tax=Litchfieldia alkalitelluris TaxID=304268 RepID=UPI0009973D76|nr:G5 domain-containing protein [Litchfieldia alkalitelluris]
MNNQLKVKLVLILVSCVAFIFVFSQIGTMTYSAVASGDKFETGTKIGSVNVEGLSNAEAFKLVESEVNSWLAVGDITISFGHDTGSVLKNDSLQFYVKESIEAAKHGMDNPLIVTYKESSLNQAIETSSNKKMNSFQENQLIQKLLSDAAMLTTGQIELDLLSFLVVGEQIVVSEAEIPLETASAELTKWVKDIKEVSLEPHGSFSVLNIIEENGFEASDETLSIVGTAIYEVILPTNIDIVERHLSEHLPTYAKLGYEARVENDSKDLMLYNTNPFEYKVTFKLTDKGLKTELVGPELPHKYRVELGEVEEVKPKTIKQYDSKLSFGSKVVKVEGENGTLLNVTRITTKGKKTEETSISDDYYRPVHKVVALSLIGSGLVTTPDDNETPDPEDSDEEDGFFDDDIDLK